MRRAATFLVMIVPLLIAACAPPPAGSTTALPASAPAGATTSAQADPPATSLPAPSAANGPCPAPPVTAIAVENFYGSILGQLGGQCVNITTILANPSADPHEYQPTVNDARSYQVAQFIVENGLGYDDFSNKIIATMSQKPSVLNVGAMLGLEVGANPHVWYNPDYLEKIARAMTQGLKRLAPSAAAYFDSQSAEFFGQGLEGYRASLTQLQTRFKGTPVASTESIFSYMATATGLNLVSPPAFMDAVAESNDPSARDLAIFQDQITKRQVKVLVYNTQTVTNLTERLKAMATANGIPTVGVSETMPPDARSFQDWQTTQLQRLIEALASTGGRQ